MFYTNRKHWTTAEENFVTENADKMTTAEIARKINRTEVAVQQYITENGSTRMKRLSVTWCVRF